MGVSVSIVHVELARIPSLSSGLPISSPSVSRGTTKQVIPRCLSSGSQLAKTRKTPACLMSRRHVAPQHRMENDHTGSGECVRWTGGGGGNSAPRFARWPYCVQSARGG